MMLSMENVEKIGGEFDKLKSLIKRYFLTWNFGMHMAEWVRGVSSNMYCECV